MWAGELIGFGGFGRRRSLEEPGTVLLWWTSGAARDSKGRFVERSSISFRPVRDGAKGATFARSFRFTSAVVGYSQGGAGGPSLGSSLLLLISSSETVVHSMINLSSQVL